MGELNVEQESDPEHLRMFMQQVLRDVRALEAMLEGDWFETGVDRIGAEQELFLVGPGLRPASLAVEALAAIDDPRFTTELASFNLEANLDPIDIGPDSLRRLEQQLDELLAKARKGARSVGAEVLLTGILPTLEKSDLSLDNMTPVPRYFALAEAAHRLRGTEFEFHIKGRDELTTTHDSVMVEACNTSFQLHLQVDPDRFAPLYNIAQTLTAPVLAAATNSPCLFGKRLWSETRIALFRQAIDTRPRSLRRQQPTRVSFGESWLDESVLELFREDIARFRLLISTDIDEDPLERLAAGEVPKLKALCLHNGTVYHWNRACYGCTGGRPHLRIENRVLPAGPSVLDEIANAALWFGLIKAFASDIEDIRRHIDFDAVKENFLAAARLGLQAQFRWLDGRQVTARDLICTELLPRARSGLQDSGIDPEDISRTLDVIEQRVESGRTGSQWALDSLAAMRGEGMVSERMASLTAGMLARQKEGRPVHTWSLVQLREGGGWEKHYARVGNLMTTDLFTVNQNDAVDLVASLMDWKHIRHVPVEDDAHKLVGLVTHRALLRVLAERHDRPREPIPVREIMQKDVLTVTPEMPTVEALRLMKERGFSGLPVVEGDYLVGIVTERDFMKLASELLIQHLSR